MRTLDLSSWSREAHRLAKAKGFWDGCDPFDPHQIAVKIALMHSEVSELLEAHRDGPQEPCDKEGLGILTREEEECADILLRLVDYCGARGIDLGFVAEKKFEYNKTRPYTHGKKF